MSPEFAYAVYPPPIGPEVDTLINSLDPGTGVFINIKQFDQVTPYAVLVSGGGAPEIDGSLAPKVGFLLGCLILIFSRKNHGAHSLAVV
ncbi:hypothetical protein [Polynucleobacter sp. P1-05-14]|uniref:hypothetical protein n=1 Tax=Polynucleobacter sp. P1-05-14 TaxID=1819732 RepID=UPI001C0BB4B3|nr:hypothetical protein [Polynucleobacter sp. P1-05-14]MBU3549113.1 hypothetical protein [Polynucleobacter sp. P1-05-14]